MKYSTEQWKDIPGYEGRYQASTFGRIKSLARIIKTGAVPVFHLKSRILRPAASRQGYLHLPLEGKDHRIHRLVALTWLPNPANKEQVNHIDGKKANNHVSNLEWTTRAENMKHASALGLHCFGENKPDAKLTNKQVIAIRWEYKQGNQSQSEIARAHGVHPSVICRIVNNKKWKLI